MESRVGEKVNLFYQVMCTVVWGYFYLANPEGLEHFDILRADGIHVDVTFNFQILIAIFFFLSLFEALLGILRCFNNWDRLYCCENRDMWWKMTYYFRKIVLVTWVIAACNIRWSKEGKKCSEEHMIITGFVIKV